MIIKKIKWSVVLGGCLISQWVMADTGLSVCDLQSVLKFNSQQLSAKAVKNKIISSQIVHSNNELNAAKSNIKNCNLAIKQKLVSNQREISTLMSIQSDIIANRDFSTINLQTTQYRNAQKTIRNILPKHLKGVKYKGLFLTLIKYPSYFESKKSLKSMAHNIIEKDAIVSMNRMFLKTVPKLSISNAMKSEINQLISGNMVLEENYLSESNPSKKVYFNLSKISVKPVEAGSSALNSTEYPGYQSKVFFIEDNQWQNSLAGWGVSDKQIKKINKVVNTFSSSVKNENSRIQSKQQEAILDMASQIGQYENKINKLEQQKQQQLKILSSSYIKIGLECNNLLYRCVNHALSTIKATVNEKNQQLVSLKQFDLFYKEGTVAIKNSPAQDIAKYVMELMNQMISQYETLNPVAEISNNKASTSQLNWNQYQMKRGLKNFWVYIVPQEEDMFYVLTSTQFKIKTSREKISFQPHVMAKNSQVDTINCLKEIPNSLLKNTPLIHLTVKFNVEGANVRIMNISEKYYPGILLYPGAYHLEVNKEGFDVWKKWVYLSHSDMTVNVSLKKSNATINDALNKYALTVKTMPLSANIKIMNIDPKYSAGMLLKPQYYDVQVTKRGYHHSRQWLKMDNKDLTVSVNLRKKDVKDVGFLTLNSNYADATVYIDRQLMNNRFNKQIKLSSGLHEVVVEKPGYRCWNQSFDLKKSEKVKLYAVLTPKKIIKLKNIKPVLTENNIVKTKPIQSQPPLKSSSLVKKVELTPKPTIKQKKINKIAPIMKAPSNLMVGKTWTENKTNMEFMGVPGGCFQMGSVDGISNEKPVHEVCVDDFFMGKFEVTQKQWNLVMGNNPADFQSWVQKTDDYPVESVSWEDVQSYVSKLNQMTGHVFRLPSEAEWEFACRGKSHQDIFSGGNSSVTVDEIANICDKKCQYEWRSKQHDDGYEKISPVGLKKPNSYGLYDMSGNVWEWIEDGYDELAYEKHLNKNPLITGGKKKVGRGGSWVVHYQLSRCAARRDGEKNKKANDLGFRLIKLN